MPRTPRPAIRWRASVHGPILSVRSIRVRRSSPRPGRASRALFDQGVEEDAPGLNHRLVRDRPVPFRHPGNRLHRCIDSSIFRAVEATLHRATPHGLESQKGCPSKAASSPMCHAISIRAIAKWAVSVLPSSYCVRQSATRHRLIGSLSFGNLREPAIHGVAINHWQPAVAAFAATVRRSNSFAARSQASRPSQPMWSAIALSPGIIDALPKMRVAKLVRALSFGRPGSTGAEKWVQNAANHSVKGSIAMQRPSISNETQAFVFSTPSTTLTSLTVSSRGTRMLRIRAPQLWR